MRTKPTVGTNEQNRVRKRKRCSVHYATKTIMPGLCPTTADTKTLEALRHALDEPPAIFGNPTLLCHMMEK